MGRQVDRRNKLDDEPFSFRKSKDGKIMLFYKGRNIKTIAGKEASAFLKKAEALTAAKDLQLLLAKATGNFKMGNER